LPTPPGREEYLAKIAAQQSQQSTGFFSKLANNTKKVFSKLVGNTKDVFSKLFSKLRFRPRSRRSSSTANCAVDVA
jgi:hypothetical protein